MFKITGGKGFNIAFANGYKVSVQWGWGNYCDNRNARIDFNKYEQTQQKLGAQGSATAEVAIIDPNDDFCGKRLGIFEHDDVEGYCTPARVVEILNQVIKLP